MIEYATERPVQAAHYLLIISPNWNYPACPSPIKQINKCWCICAEEYDTAVKKESNTESCSSLGESWTLS